MGKERKNRPGYKKSYDSRGRTIWVPIDKNQIHASMKKGTLNDAASDFSARKPRPSPNMMRRSIAHRPSQPRTRRITRPAGSVQKAYNDGGNNFDHDMKENAVLEKFMDSEIYPYIFTSVQRKHDRDSQFKGIDIIADGVRIDEKAQIKYKNENLATNAFEISHVSKKPFYRDGEFAKHDVDGWFVSDDMETEKYLIVSLTDVDVEYDDDRLEDESQVNGVIMYLVDKYDLLDEVEKHMDIDDMVDKADDMRDKGERTYDDGDIRLVGSYRFQEKPVSLIWKKHRFPEGTRVIEWKRDKGIIEDYEM